MNSRSILVAVLMCGVLIWCVGRAMHVRQARSTSAPLRSGNRAEVIVGDEASDAPQMPFTISNVSKNQKLIESKPWHSAGGDWTWMDCQTADTSPIAFGVGIQFEPSGKMFSFEKVAIAVPDAQTGARFVERFATAFGAALPARKSAQPLKLTILNSSDLGGGMGREPRGGFSGSGNWTPTKWFVSLAGKDDAEVFFNFDLIDKVGEFSEKDHDYRQDLAEAFAEILRDGPRPRRTSADDPGIVDDGPKIVDLHEITGIRNGFQCFSADGSLAFFTIPTDETHSEIFAIEPLHPKDRKSVIVMEGALTAVSLDADGSRVIVNQRISKEPQTYSTEDVRHIWLVNRNSGEKRELLGPWGLHDSMAENGVSPDHRFIVVDHFMTTATRKGTGYGVLDFYDLLSGKTVTAEISGVSLSISSWTSSGGVTEAILAAGNLWEQIPKPAYSFNPLLSKLTRLSTMIRPDGPLISPDGKLQAEIRPQDRLIVTDLATDVGRQFVFHEDDRRFVDADCVKWVGPNFLSFNNGELMLIDIGRMKMSRVLPDQFHDCRVDFSPGLKWAVVHGEKSDWVGSVVASSMRN